MIKFILCDEDKWLSKEGTILPYDKLEHFLLSFFGMVIGIFLLKFSPMATALLIAIIGIGWEIKDGIKEPDSHGNVQGFS